MSAVEQRPTWDEYFLMLAKLAATRSTCLAIPVGAVIVKDRQVLATGYNGPPSKSAHCSDQGFCYYGLERCGGGSGKPSRAIHAEANAIAQAARHGIATNGASIYVTCEPCISCLKLIISAGIAEVFYETARTNEEEAVVRKIFIEDEHLIKQYKQIVLPEAIAQKAASFLLSPTSLPAINTAINNDSASLLSK